MTMRRHGVGTGWAVQGSTGFPQRAGTDQRWYVTASHRLPPIPYKDSGDRPFGTRHARRPGDPTTACGQVALDWPIFWETEYSATDDESCDDCSVVVARGAIPPFRSIR